jgi:hypothetical protein
LSFGLPRPQVAAAAHDQRSLHPVWKDIVCKLLLFRQQGYSAMDDINVTLDWPADADTEVRVCRLDGSEVPVRLRLLGYDCCEFESDDGFAPGEQVSIHLYRMGWIRAWIARQEDNVVQAEFDKSCPV